MKPILIVGPCAAESREQLLATARALHPSTLDSRLSTLDYIFRAGIWKPRTSPATFQGVGEQALDWLVEVKRETGMEVATEVATPEHVHAALQAGIDYLWIGARTSANPMAVQSIADSLHDRQPKRVFIKNPVNNDPQLWLGNIARLEATGVTVAAIHRGCAHRPCWDMAYAVRTARPDIPMLLDPSHMTGDSQLVATAMNRVGELGLNGAMIEVHCCPEQALSDARQQITPDQLRDILASAFLPFSKGTDHLPLHWLRAMIDEVDADIWTHIERRMALAEQIGEYKKSEHMAPLQPERFEAILHQRLEWADMHHIQSDTVRMIMNALHQEALRRQS